MSIFKTLKDKFINSKVVCAESPHEASEKKETSLVKVAVWLKPSNVSAEDWRATIQAVQANSKKTGIPEQLLLAVIWKESSFNPRAVSRAGARGLMQLMPKTAAGECGLGIGELFDIDKNVACGSRYLEKRLAQFQDLQLALAAYNHGQGNIIKKIEMAGSKNYGNIKPLLPVETQNYVSRILEKIDWRNNFV